MTDTYTEKRHAIAKYVQRNIRDPQAWDKLHDEISLAYRKGRLSDSEYDHLLSDLCRVVSWRSR